MHVHHKEIKRFDRHTQTVVQRRSPSISCCPIPVNNVREYEIVFYSKRDVHKNFAAGRMSGCLRLIFGICVLIHLEKKSAAWLFLANGVCAWSQSFSDAVETFRQ